MDFEKFLTTLKDNLTEEFNNSVESYLDYLIIDGVSFASRIKEDIERWGQMFLAGQITKKDFQFLLESKKNLAEMNALKQAGLAQVKLEELQNKLIETIIGSFFSVVV